MGQMQRLWEHRSKLWLCWQVENPLTPQDVLFFNGRASLGQERVRLPQDRAAF